MANIENRAFADEEFAWAHKELDEVVKSCGTSDAELEQLGRFYYELIMERRAKPPTQNQLTVKGLKEITIKGERYFSTAEEPSVIARINATRRHGYISAALGLVVPLISESVGYLAGVDTRQITLTGLAGGATGLGLCRFLIFVDKNSYLPASYPFWGQRPQLDGSR